MCVFMCSCLVTLENIWSDTVYRDGSNKLHILSCFLCTSTFIFSIFYFKYCTYEKVTVKCVRMEEKKDVL